LTFTTRYAILNGNKQTETAQKAPFFSQTVPVHIFHAKIPFYITKGAF
jgi:hypothetical protein